MHLSLCLKIKETVRNYQILLAASPLTIGSVSFVYVDGKLVWPREVRVGVRGSRGVEAWA